ncbi:MAG: hypothetical protein KY432_01520, partial [Acidobacteria bacterium]|nr:hypothetical protein [Acidobacteriota bacterium]
MRSNLLRLTITLLVLLCSSTAFAQSRVDVLDERILTPPDPGPLYEPYLSTSIKPVWSGTDWAVVWRDERALEGTYAQRIGTDGSVAFSPNRRIGSQYPHSMVRFGTGYLMS